MIERRAIDRDTVHVIRKLDVHPTQRDLVAPNVVTLAEAPYETGSRVWGLWDGDIAVGLMAMVHPGEYLWHRPGDDTEAAYLWRLMIAADHQGKGYGRGAIEQALDVTRSWGLPRLVASVVDAAHSNMAFYERLGFRRTGRIVEGEIEITRDV